VIPLVYDPDVDPSTNKSICTHNPGGASPHYEDVDMRKIWHIDEYDGEGTGVIAMRDAIVENTYASIYGQRGHLCSDLITYSATLSRCAW
jgi:hypothetical protein